MSRNAKTFPNPETFDPDRYLNEDGTWNTEVLDPSLFAFGFGRRYIVDLDEIVLLLILCFSVCPGRHFAIASIYIYAASILHVYNISPKRDMNGKPIEIKADMVSGVVTWVDRFVLTCAVDSLLPTDIPRSSNAISHLALLMPRVWFASVGREVNHGYLPQR